MRQPDIPAPIAPDRRPALRFPPGVTDCHAHVFGAQDRYPLLQTTHFVPHEKPWPSYAAMSRSLGCERTVLVQPSFYSTDNAAIEDTLAQADDIELRAVTVVAPEVSDAKLKLLQMLGFRGIRFNTGSGKRGLRLEHARGLADRIRHLGWHLQFYADFHKNPEAGQVLAGLPVPVVIDHFGRIRAGDGVDSPGFQAVLRLLARENCWAKLIGPHFISDNFPAYEEIVPFARAMLALAPDRVVWGTDWPHASARARAREKIPADADLADLLAQWVPDNAGRQLVDNPARLYGFTGLKTEEITT